MPGYIEKPCLHKTTTKKEMEEGREERKREEGRGSIELTADSEFKKLGA